MTPVEKTEREDILRAAHDWRFRIEAPDATEADREAFAAWRAADPRHGDLYDYAVTFYHALGTLDAGDLDDDVLRRTPLEYLTQLRDRLAYLFKQTQYRLAAAGATAFIVVAVVVVVVHTYGSSRRLRRRRRRKQQHQQQLQLFVFMVSSVLAQ